MSDRERMDVPDPFDGLEALGWVCTMDGGITPVARRPGWGGYDWLPMRLASLVQDALAAAREEEREACAKVAEEHNLKQGPSEYATDIELVQKAAAVEIAASIRAREDDER